MFSLCLGQPGLWSSSMLPPVAVMAGVCYCTQLFLLSQGLVNFLGWSGTVTLLISASHISRHSHVQLLVEMESLNLFVHVGLKQWSFSVIALCRGGIFKLFSQLFRGKILYKV
jgi:hypothetical protein